MKSKFLENGRIPNWLTAIIAAVVIVAVIFLVVGVLHQKSQSDNQTAKQTKNEAGGNNGREAVKGQIFSYIGKVTEIKDDKIKFLAKASKNRLNEDTEMTAIISSKTRFSQVSIPKVLPKEVKKGNSGSIFTRKEIKFSDLKVGDEITVVSKENIANKNKFSASRIELMKVK